jgi:beta-lactamase regulating signal transducer with metallopeptidase domain
MIKINKNLTFFSSLILLLGGVLLFTLQKFSPILDHATYYCRSFIETHMIPIPYYLNVLPFALLFTLVSISLIKFAILNLKVQFLQNKLKKKSISQQNEYSVITRLGLEEKTIVIKSEKYFAYCLGIRNPKIYVSTGLIKSLSDQELEAVLQHEQYHIENYDTFTMTIASIAQSLFPFFPLISDLIQKYRVEREIKADCFAVKKSGSSLHLISALQKLLIAPSSHTVGIAAIADHDTLEPRIHSLLNKKYLRRQFRIKHLLISLVSAAFLGVIIATPVQAKEIHHEGHDVVMVCTDGECMNSCSSEKNLNKLYSAIPTHESINLNILDHVSPLD